MCIKLGIEEGSITDPVQVPVRMFGWIWSAVSDEFAIGRSEAVHGASALDKKEPKDATNYGVNVQAGSCIGKCNFGGVLGT